MKTERTFCHLLLLFIYFVIFFPPTSVAGGSQLTFHLKASCQSHVVVKMLFVALVQAGIYISARDW